MGKLKLSALLALAIVAFATIPVGTARSQEVAASGTALISDNQALSDAITVTITGLVVPGADTAIEGWLVSDDGETKLSIGIMDVDVGGAVSHTYTSPDGDNLIHLYDKVVVTEEPVPDADPGPSDVVLLSDQIPAGGIAHIRHLLTNWPPGESKGILTNLKDELDLAILHANLAKDSTTLEDLRLHTHHTINIIEGPDGPNYDISFGHPGGGLGVLLHAQDRKHGPFASGAAVDDAEIVAGAARVDATGKNAEDWATLARDIALNSVLSETNLALAKVFLGPGVDSVISNLEAARNGFDADNDGTIESIAGEGGADQAYLAAQEMAIHTLAGP